MAEKWQPVEKTATAAVQQPGLPQQARIREVVPAGNVANPA